MPNPARIAFVAPFGLGQKTTVWARSLPLARHLAGRGHVVKLIIPPWDTSGDVGRRGFDGGVEVVQVAINGGAAPTVRRMVGEVAAFRPDLVHIIKPRAHAGLVQWWLWMKRAIRHSPVHNSQFTARLSSPKSIHNSQLSRPAILLDIDDWEQSWAAVNRYAWPVARFLAWQEEWGLRHADGVTAASRWLVERMKRYAPQTPVLYLPNGVDLRHYDATIPEQPLERPMGAPGILFYTRFVEVEPEWLAAFWHALHAQRPAARLLVAGAPFQPGRQECFQQAVFEHDPVAAQQVEWLGFVTPEQQELLCRTASCAVFPAMPIPLLQAKCSVRLATTLLHGVPVVASAVGEQSAYGANGAALLVSPEASPGEFAATVLTLLDDPTAQAAMVAAARRHLCTAYSWPQLGDQLMDFYARWL
jgi:glycosyltransferase involved in cell wall biosynthesis